MEKKTLFEIVNCVEDEQSFIDFINSLKMDRLAVKKCQDSDDEWQNHTIEDFLEQAHEWAEESKNGLEYYQKPTNAWKRCAQILYMGKIYE